MIVYENSLPSNFTGVILKDQSVSFCDLRSEDRITRALN